MTETQVEQAQTFAPDGCAGKMSPVSSPQTSAKISRQSSRKSSASQNQKPSLFLYLRKDGQPQGASWESMENGRWPIECWMQNAGESPKEESASTLSQILQQKMRSDIYQRKDECLQPNRQSYEYKRGVERERAAKGECAKNTYPKFHGRHKHRVVAEKMLGRKLRPGEVVHHINENKHDCSPENLMVFSSQKEHAAYHAAKSVVADRKVVV